MGNIIIAKDKWINKKDINDSVQSFEDNYAMDECVVRLAFETFDNSSVDNILAKTIILNDRYSTRLNKFKCNKENIAIDVITMSEYIYEKTRNGELDYYKNLDKVIGLIEELSNVGNKKKPISFLSKFFHWNFYVKNSSTRIPMYDGYTRGMIYKLSKHNYVVDNITQNKLKEYRYYCEVYNMIKQKVLEDAGLEHFTVKQFDMFLWWYGKKNGIYI